MGASLVSRVTYAAASRLDGIGKCAIGNMIFSALTSSLGIVIPTHNIIAVAQAWCKSESGGNIDIEGLTANRICFTT